MTENPHYEAIIFDLDGTLLDTLADLTNACNRAITEAGCRSLTQEQMKAYIGFGARQLVAGAVRASHPEWTDEQIEPIFLNYRQYYKAAWQVETKLYPGMMDLLSKLKTAGVKLAVLSNKPHDSTQTMVDFYFPEAIFDSCYGQLDPWPVKPDPALALQIARELATDPARMALVGDSGSDIAAALRAGMTGIGVLYGFREQAELESAGPVLLAEDTAALRTLLLGKTS